jgi:hypothetical protein
MCPLYVGLPDVKVLAVEADRDGLFVSHVEQTCERPRCSGCGSRSGVKDRDPVELADLPCFGRPTRLVWHKVRLACPDRECPVGTWTWEDPRIAPARAAMTDRAGRWATVQVGRLGRTVAEVARELGSDWHTVNSAVIAYGTVLVDDPERFGEVQTLGLDETQFCRRGRWARQEFATSIVNVTPAGPPAARCRRGPQRGLELPPQPQGLLTETVA